MKLVVCMEGNGGIVKGAALLPSAKSHCGLCFLQLGAALGMALVGPGVACTAPSIWGHSYSA